MLALERIRDARVLQEAGCYSAAYYLAGYAVECALKARIARLILAETYPEKDSTKSFYHHDLERLKSKARLDDEYRAAVGESASLQTNWNTVKDWSGEARYVPSSEKAVRDLIDAIDDPHAGVLSWLKKYW